MRISDPEPDLARTGTRIFHSERLPDPCTFFRRESCHDPDQWTCERPSKWLHYAVRQFAPAASDTNIRIVLTPTAAKIRELIASLDVPFHPSMIERRVTNTSKKWVACWPGCALRRSANLHRSSERALHSGGLDPQIHHSYQRKL